jgi:SAM-dependent methyltransferase
LARQGARVTGVDISAGFLEEARRSASDVDWIQSDMRNLPWTSRFDAAYCWGNSFGYFDHDNCQKFLDAVAAALRPGGRFILESGAVTESLVSTFRAERQLQIGDLDFWSRGTYDVVEGRMDITYTFARGERREVKPIHQWVHSAAELRRMLSRSGLEPLAAFGDLEGARYALGSPRFIALMRRAG